MPKIVDHKQYRKELLMKSFDLFAEKGYASITMREIAKGLGVSTGTLYHYFPSKEALFLQLIEELTKQDILNFLAEAGDVQTLAERIKSLMNFVAKNEDYFFKQNLLMLDFYQQQERTELLHNQTLSRVWDDAIQALASYLEIEDRAIADFIYCLINGLISARMFEGDTISYTEQSDLLANMLTAYLENREKESLAAKIRK
ncbi:MAG: TetR/AcrR family transcriptional regulator [Pelatocladus maniniholoensis HA4357-MV3]|jgi:AcrR family transcriptional regulator|uniref:TetR/AcrR family transcriptional regulator n=1 Tax=Pelatocladus maniniholoensis HA4357-MV3 TaxID=1117104 RepID=A0A9E3LTT9_9NOST|nr:TetR/AcrR family transcriptional regulator [Pelatocladus maniniholoensis HA4357-MV3]